MTLKLRLHPRPAIIARVIPRLSGVTLVAGDNIDIDQVGNIYTISANTITLDAQSYNGMQINGSMDVSQENGTAGITPSSTPTYVVDGWMVAMTQSGAATWTASPTAAAGNPYFTNSIYIGANAATTFGVNDYALFFQHIEGYRAARLNFGGAFAQSVTIGFWVLSPSAACTMCVSLRNSALNRSYVTNVTVNVANTWEYKTVTIPGDTTGTWLKTSGIGLRLTFAVASGATYQNTADTWATGNFFATPQITNPFALSSNTIYITGVVVLPGSAAPSAAQSPLILRSFGQELEQCKRYYNKYVSGIVSDYAGAGATSYFQFLLSPAMRSAPTLAFNNVAYSNGSDLAAHLTNSNSYLLRYVTTGSGSSYVGFDAILDARL